MPDFVADDAASIKARWEEIKAEEERARTHCRVCGLDLRGATWCSRQAPGCTLPGTPPGVVTS